MLQALDGLRRMVCISGLEVAQALQLTLFFLFGRPRQLDLHFLLGRIRIQKSVHADDRQGTIVLLCLVINRFILDLAALVAGLHGAQHPAPLGYALELLQHRLFDEISEFLDDEGALAGVFILGQTPFAVDDHLDRQRPPDRRLRRRGDRFVVGVGMQTVAVVVGGNQCLQRGSNVVEIDFLGMQRPARGLNVILEFLAALVGPVLEAHRGGPDPAGDPPHHRILHVHAVGKEK